MKKKIIPILKYILSYKFFFSFCDVMPVFKLFFKRLSIKTRCKRSSGDPFGASQWQMHFAYVNEKVKRLIPNREICSKL